MFDQLYDLQCDLSNEKSLSLMYNFQIVIVNLEKYACKSEQKQNCIILQYMQY